MYNATEIRERFIQEINRVYGSSEPNLSQMEKDCKLKAGDLWRIHERRIMDIRAVVIVQFVQTYRSYDVSYEYIYEGKRAANLYQEIREEIKREVIAYVQKI